nr:hypothetical protein CFP56_35754 [Quercus suber]
MEIEQWSSWRFSHGVLEKDLMEERKGELFLNLGKLKRPLPSIAAGYRDTLSIITNSNETDICLVGKRPKLSLSRCFQPPTPEVFSASNTRRCRKGWM